jgi:CO dehydrogenase maturation factor
MKLAITGKGGVGKTTIASLLSSAFAAEGKDVIAIDANPDANLAAALGFSEPEIRKIAPIVELHNIIKERTGADPGSPGSFFKLNPKVDDLPEHFSISKGNIKLLVMGTVKRGGSGCLCPESAILKSLLSHLVLSRSEVVILDMDAGLENLGRGTAQSVDAFLIIVEPGQRSFQSARSIVKLAKDLGTDNCFVVGSKTKDENDRLFIQNSLPEFNVLGFVNFYNEVAEADRSGLNVAELSIQALMEIEEIKKKLEEVIINK